MRALSTSAKKRSRVVLAYEEAAPSSAAAACSSAAAPSSPARAAAAAAAAAEPLPTSPARGWGKAREPNAHWEAQLAAIKAMRALGGSASSAAVDTMGCNKCADPAATEVDQRFQTLVSLMLSSQTKDEVTYATCLRLRALPGGFTARNLAAMGSDEISAVLLGPPAVGFWKKKGEFLASASRHCSEKLAGDIPDSVAALCELKGVGPKMAFIAMHSAWGKNVGIGVDTHVHRIANRLGWVKSTAPELTQAHLQSWLPREHWDCLNELLVGFGQTVCKPVAPRCGECDARLICPSSTSKKK